MLRFASTSTAATLHLSRPPSPCPPHAAPVRAVRDVPPRSCRVPAGAMKEEGSATHILPPSGDARQVYDHSQPAASLQTNCQQLGFSIGSSPFGRALVAERAFKTGEVAGHMWGKLVDTAVHSAISSSFVDPSYREGEEDYCTPIKEGIWRTVETGDAGEVLLVSEQCPMSLINHSETVEQRNVSIDLTSTSYRRIAPTLKKEERWRVFEILVTRPIAAGEQLYADYGWSDKDWKVLKQAERRRLRNSHVPKLASKVSLQLHTGSTLFNLNGAAEKYQDKLQRQQDRLHDFINSVQHRTEIASMPYQLHTVAPARARPSPVLATQLGRSTLKGHGLLGLFPLRDHPPASARDNRSVAA